MDEVISNVSVLGIGVVLMVFGEHNGRFVVREESGGTKERSKDLSNE